MKYAHSQLFVVLVITLIHLFNHSCEANYLNNNNNNNDSNNSNNNNKNNERYIVRSLQNAQLDGVPLHSLDNQQQQKEFEKKIINRLNKHQKRSLSSSSSTSTSTSTQSSIGTNLNLINESNDSLSVAEKITSTITSNNNDSPKSSPTSSSLSSTSTLLSPSSSSPTVDDHLSSDLNLAAGSDSASCLNASGANCYDVNVTTSVYCDSDDDIPCNITQEEYMEFLYEYLYPKTAEWILFTLHAIVFITGLVGNALVCIAVYTNYSMRTVTNIYIVNLAIADFLVILVCLPPTVAWDILETWFLGKTMCKIVTYCQSISVTVSVLTLTFISVDRWYAICFPLRYRTKISRAFSSVAFIWIVALISHIPELLALTLREMKLRYKTILFTQCSTTWDKDTEKDFYLARFVLLYLLPLLLMMVAYFKIVRVLWKSDTIPGHRESRNHHQYSCSYARGSCMTTANTSTMGQLQARRKAAKMLVSVVIMFAVCYFPVHLFNILRYTDLLPYGEATNVISLFSHWLMYANSAVNPVIYNFMSGKFRKEFRNALEKCRCARVRVEDRCLNHSNPPSRLNNISPSTRSNYQLTSVRDITRDFPSRQSMQTNFIENYGNGHTTTVSSQKLSQTNTDRSL